jgi:hypothetical protein
MVQELEEGREEGGRRREGGREGGREQREGRSSGFPF